MEKNDFHHKLLSLVRARNASDRFINYLAPTEVQRIHAELSDALCCAM